jgi:hypothetical protein
MVDESPGAVLAAPENGGWLLVVVLPLAGLRNVTAGPNWSIDQATRAGVASALPEELMARTAKP